MSLVDGKVGGGEIFYSLRPHWRGQARKNKGEQNFIELTYRAICKKEQFDFEAIDDEISHTP